MTARSELKVRVALGFSKLIVLVFVSLSAHAQSTDDLLQRNVTITGRNIDFEDVLDQLTLQTKMRFIYSSSMVSLDKQVTLMARQQPLKDVLDELAAQMNITFKRQGDYFIVKKDNTPSPKTHFALAQPKLANSEDPDEEEFNVEESNTQRERFNVYRISQQNERDSKITKDLLNVGDKLKWKYQPMLMAESGPNRSPMPWFASAGFLINDYGVGVEMQAGIPLIHGVASISALGDGMYRFGYGLGTSIRIKPLVTGDVAYTFASLSHTETDSWHHKFQATSHHHQIRLQASLSLSNHFSVRVGPTFNLLRSSYQYIPEPNGSSVTVRYRPAPTQQYLSPSQGYTRTIQYQAIATPMDYETINSWFGFELGVAYRVNFSLRK
jgi:hypothetical protein